MLRYRIHPAIGIARLGNSPDFFIGPELPGVPGNLDETSGAFRSFRDASGQILRQGARFRVFEYADIGSSVPPREVSLGDEILDIEWRVHLANRKASFYAFHGQLGASDLFAARGRQAPSDIVARDPDRTNLRNADVPVNERADRLEIDPGEKLVSSKQPGPVELANAKLGVPIKSLGTLRVDEKGRLIVLGGYGEANSTNTPPLTIDDYANNDAWFDDAGDGSVRARLRFKNGTTIDADAAWLLVGPPKFAPGIGNVVSLFDTLWDIGVRDIAGVPPVSPTPLFSRLLEQQKVWQANNGASLTGFKPSFLHDIYPLLKRAIGARDVHESGIANPNFHRRLLTDWATLSAQSGSSASDGKDLREEIFGWIRDPKGATVEWKKMPRGLGDDYTELDDSDGRSPTVHSFLSLTQIQYAVLREWAAGNFIDDWPGAEPTAPSPKQDPTPDDLDQAAVENCVGGPFYPGIEVSWLVRVKDLYAEPFRFQISPQPEGGRQPAAPVKVGALEFRPGFFSQQMALPWQADFYDCHKEKWGDPVGNEYFFMWWTAQRPDDVYPAGGTAKVRWVRAFDDGTKTVEDIEANNDRFEKMRTRWSELKFVTVKNGDHYEEER